jgi:hypothetical protein
MQRNRIKNDIIAWLPKCPHKSIEIHIIVMALHSYGEYYATTQIQAAASKIGKQVKINFWRIKELEDRLKYSEDSEVLRPHALPKDRRTQKYVQMLTDKGYPPNLRPVKSTFSSEIFSTEEARQMLEQQFLIKGAEVLELCTNLRPSIRPLGFSGLHGLGFGAMVFTYRNCPNTLPAVFWVDSPWFLCFIERQISMSGLTNNTRYYDAQMATVFHKTREEFGGLSNMATGFPYPSMAY